MFSLEKSIVEWRRQMEAAGIKTPAVLDELESHLREEIDRQTRDGVKEEQAFAAAAQKIGAARKLQREFRKTALAAVLEKLMLGTAVLFAAFGIFLTTATMVFCYGTLLERLAGFTALAFIIAIVFGSRQMAPLLPVIPHTRKRFLIQLACIGAGFAICTLYVQVFVRQFERPGHMIPVIAFWGILPIALGFALASALEQTVRRSKMNAINA